jgi:ribosomal protein S18 acetylase RimI-like enzyme
MAGLARGLASAGRPFDLWTPPLTPEDVRAAADRVARGEAEVLWADEADADRGFLIYAPSPGETAFFGYGCARLAGPYLPPEDQEKRESGAARLAGLAAARARDRGDRLATLKTGLDPAALRGLLAGGFVLAETVAVLALDLALDPARPAGPPPGFAWLEPGREEAAALVEDLGGFFYDGHLRHDPKPGPEAARLIWRRTALDDLAGAAHEAVVLWDRAGRRWAGLATARLAGREAGLSILALAGPYRGRGLGRPLLAELIRRLAGRPGRLRAETAAYNLPALALYQALGFRPAPPLAALHLHLE